MPAHLSTTGSGPAAWQELEDVFAGLGQWVRSPAPPHEFYRELLDQSVRALSAVGGAIWLRADNSAFQLAAQNNWPVGTTADMRQAHEALLAKTAAKGRIASIAPSAAGRDSPAGNPTEFVLLIAPVQMIADWEAPATIGDPKSEARNSTTLAVIELLERPDAGPSSHLGHEQFLTAVCELAADYHAFRELRRLRHDQGYRQQLLRLGRIVHRDLDLSETAYAVANDGRGVIGCDRLSVLLSTGRGRCRLLATSGAQRVERRSSAARRLEELGQLVGRTADAAFYDDGQCDALPQIADALARHAETSQARQIAAVPLIPPADPAANDGTHRPAKWRRMEPAFVLIAEQFDAQSGDLVRQRLVEVAEVCTTALTNAQEVDRMPLGWLLRPLGAVKQRLVARWLRFAVAAAGLAAAIAALVVVQADFNIEATGTMQPVVQRAAFAPRSGLVEEVLVKHGADVQAGQPLVRLRDPALDLEMKRVHGELETAQRQIDAVRATKTGRPARDATPTETYRLSAEERELDQRLTNLRRELELLDHEREQLVVTSPIAGRVLTWDVASRLAARPVERGEVLVTIADLSADWQLALDVPDNRVGHVLAAQQKLGPALPVRFRLSSEDRESPASEGHIAEVCRTADVATKPGAAPSPMVRVNVALDTHEFDDATRSELRPGVSARAQIACGRRSVGYVWLHDIWDAAIGWIRF
jgi:multidrug efflux pump subunit AcrA (membrane-fusion protein)